MKVSRSELHEGPMPQKATQPFKKLLDEAKQSPAKRLTPPPLPTKRAAARAVTCTTSAGTAASSVGTVAAKVTAQQQGEARGRVVAEANRLDGVGAGYVQQAQVATARREELSTSALERIDGRMLDLICKELQQSLDGVPTESRSRLPSPVPSAPRPQPVQQTEAAPAQSSNAGPVPTPSVDGPRRSAQAMALIERIEVFVRSARPALRLALNNSLGAEVEVERVGPRRVALKLLGTKGPPAADMVARIREELNARGLSIAALAVG